MCLTIKSFNRFTIQKLIIVEKYQAIIGAHMYPVEDEYLIHTTSTFQVKLG